MERKYRLAETLRTEYGISSMRELDAALRKLGVLDVSAFCAEVPDKAEAREERKCKCMRN